MRIETTASISYGRHCSKAFGGGALPASRTTVGFSRILRSTGRLLLALRLRD
jgi:hypothetical protein